MSVVVLLSSGSKAACVNDVFCSDQYVLSKKLLSYLSCGELWTTRNSIFDEHGYCFQRRSEAEKFDNTDCMEDTFSELELNENERQNVAVILEVEQAKFCSGRR